MSRKDIDRRLGNSVTSYCLGTSHDLVNWDESSRDSIGYNFCWVLRYDINNHHGYRKCSFLFTFILFTYHWQYETFILTLMIVKIENWLCDVKWITVCTEARTIITQVNSASKHPESTSANLYITCDLDVCYVVYRSSRALKLNAIGRLQIR